MNTTMPTSKESKPKGGNVLPALCGILGTLILLAVIAVSALLTVPRILGYEMFEVISGSMEPEIPVGSIVYTKAVPPEEIEPGDVIAFSRGEEDVVTHRVVENYGFDGKFITKGDANEINDFEPIPYENLIGRVERHIPVIGRFMALLTGTVGKIYLLGLAACGVMFNILASRLRRRNHERELIAESAFLREMNLQELGIGNGEALKDGKDDDASTKPSKKKKKRVIRGVIMGLMLLIFCASGAQVLFIRHQYRISEEIYDEAAAKFTAFSEPIVFEVPDVDFHSHPETRRIPEVAPITVDFTELKKINPDITGWIYCPGTIINYPVLHGDTNDDYLHHSYDKSYNAAGSIFVEETNSRDFQDANNILYGHHMGDKSMFATLDHWQVQSYLDEHPYMWLLTPEQDYRIALFSAYTISAYSDTYRVFPERSPGLERYLYTALELSTVKADVEVSPDGKYVLLSTCAYVFENARSVIHGLMEPASSAGGIPMKDAVLAP